MARYRLSIEVETEADPSDLLDALMEFETGYNDNVVVDEDSAKVETL